MLILPVLYDIPVIEELTKRTKQQEKDNSNLRTQLQQYKPMPLQKSISVQRRGK